MTPVEKALSLTQDALAAIHEALAVEGTVTQATQAIQGIIQQMDADVRSDPKWSAPQCVQAVEAARTADFELDQELRGPAGMITSLQKAQTAHTEALTAMQQARTAAPRLIKALEKFKQAGAVLTKAMEEEGLR